MIAEQRTIVDLSLLIDESMPSYWPTHMPFQRHVWNWYSDVVSNNPESRQSKLGPYFTEWLLMDEHTGTHFDAPAHFINDDRRLTGEQVDLNQFSGPCVVVDVSTVRGDVGGISPDISPQIIQEWEKKFRRIKPEDIVLFRTGWDQEYYQDGAKGKKYAYDVLITKEHPGWPAPTVECMQLLIDRQVRCVGTDAPSMGSAHDGAPVHQLGLGKGLVFIEALASLHRVPIDGALFLFLPLKISQSSGGMGRAVAWIPEPILYNNLSE